MMDYLSVRSGREALILFMFDCKLNSGLDRAEVGMERWHFIG